MSNTLSQQSVPRQIDPRKFAQQGIHLKGKLALSALSRLVEAVENDNGDVFVELQFAIDEQKSRTLTGTADTQVNVICQRCLEEMTLGLHCEVSLAVVWDEENARHLPRHLDPWIAPEGVTDLYEVIEEELLLALPLTAYHETACVEASFFSSGEPLEPEPENNPFQVLEQLKGSPKS